MNVVGDELFKRYYTKRHKEIRGTAPKNIPQAFAIRNSIYVRQTSNNILGDLVHEGTHARDYNNRFFGSVWQKEKRAFWYERQFQTASGSHVDFPNTNDMLYFIYRNYPEWP